MLAMLWAGDDKVKTSNFENTEDKNYIFQYVEKDAEMH